MAYRPHPKRARTDPSWPEAWGTSDRSGFIGNLRNMQWQYQWQGTELVNQRLLVYPDELDTPQRQLGALILPPDPPPVLNARVEQYTIDEQTFRVTQDGQQRYLMDGTARIESNVQSGFSQ